MPEFMKNNLFVGSVLLLMLVLISIPYFNLPHFWDGIYWVNSAEWMSRNNLNPILPGSWDYGGLDIGHPPFLFFTLALAYYLFGTSLIASHMVMVFFGFLTLYFTYRLGTCLYSKKVGFIAAIILLFSPLFYAQNHIVNLDLPLTALTVMTIYFALKNKTLLYFIIGSFMVLTKEPGMLTIIAVMIYVFIKYFKKPKKELLKKCFIYASPLLTLIFWVFLHWTQQHQVQVILGLTSFWRPITHIILLRLLNRVKVFFFDGVNWVFTFVILLSLVSNIKKLFDVKKILLAIASGLLFLFLFTYGFKFLLNNSHLLEPVLNSVHDAFFINQKNLQGVILSFYSFKFLFAILIAALVLIGTTSLSFSNFKDKRLIPVFLIFLFYFLLFSWTAYMPRYNLPLFPFFFLFSANALDKLFKKNGAYFATIIIVIILIIQWGGASTDTRGYLLEKNLEYQDSIITHKNMAEYIEMNFPNAVILTYDFMTAELRYPHLGYVKRTMNPLDYAHYDFNTKEINFALNTCDWYYYQCYLKNECKNDNVPPVGKGDIRVYDKRYKKYLTSEDFDLFYYSPQSPYHANLKNITADFNLILIKRFEKNGKYTELYSTENFLQSIKS